MEKFLATTALHSFWDTQKKIIFLGPWCKTPKNEHVWKEIEHEMMRSPWVDRKVFYEAGKYTYNTYHYLLTLLTEYLNNVHQTNFSKRFWQIIIGPWLLHFVESFYDRYMCIKKAIEEFYPFSTFYLDPKHFITPYDTSEFIELYVNDYYNLQLYTQILTKFNIAGSVRSASGCEAPPPNIKRNSMKSLLKKLLGLVSKRITLSRQYVLWDMYLSNKHLVRYLIYSKFRAFCVLYHEYPKSVIHSKAKENQWRLNLGSLPPVDEFTAILISALEVNFPTLYLEDFDTYMGKVISGIKQFPKVIFSSTGWFFNEEFKFFSAYCMEKGSKLAGFQHGGLYGAAKWMPVEEHEIEITDRFFSWGWTKKNQPKVRPLANPKISYLYYKGKNIRRMQNQQLLFVGNAHPRYLYRFFSVPVAEMYDEYLDWRNIFLRELAASIRDRILIRLYPTEYGREESAYIKREFNGMKFDNHNLSLLKQLEKSKIVIIDHPVTTMLEALSRNVPTILYWNPNSWELRMEAEGFFEELHDAQIWHKEPISAAKFLNEVEVEPLEWWNDKKTQQAREKFIIEFALADDKWAQKWWNEIKEIIN